MTTTDRVSNLNTQRTTTDRLGQTTSLGNAVDAETYNITPQATLVSGGASTNASSLDVDGTATLSAENGSFGDWLVEFDGDAAAALSVQTLELHNTRLDSDAVATTSWSSDVELDMRNVMINGDFDVWQEATSQTASGYGSSDQWAHDNSGSTKTHSRQTFALGQTDVPGNPKYFARTVVSSVAGASNYCSQRQPIEGVSTFSGETATLSFWARADASKNMAIELEQHFGTGGSPSTIVLGIGSQLVALTTSWQKFAITVAIPSVAGKTLGSDGNDHMNVRFWFDAGSDYNARAASLGQQSGTFDIAQVQLEAGSVATTFEARPYATELALCQRYWQTGGVRMLCYQLAGGGFGIHQPFPVQMRAAPTVAFQNITYLNASALSVDVSQTHGFSSSAVATATGAARYIADFTANARLP